MTNSTSASRPQVVLVHDAWNPGDVASDVLEIVNRHPTHSMPAPEELAAADMVLVIAPLNEAAWLMELGGVVRLALERGAVIVVSYATRFSGHESTFLQQFLGLHTDQTGGVISPVASDPPPAPAFRTHLVRYGQTDLRIRTLPDRAEVLAHIQTASQPAEFAPTAIAAPVDAGTVYVLPHHLTSSPAAFLESLATSVLEHRHGAGLADPAFFAHLLLPGEQELMDGISSKRSELAEVEEARVALTRHKRLIGHLAGDDLEQLVIDDLNLVLDGSGLFARDVVESYAEDFEIKNDSRVTLAEAKGASTAVTMTDVNQINSHRTQLGLAVTDLPGLVVINTFRNDQDLDRRTQPVDGLVVRHARAMNVVILRTWDLFNLVARRLAGRDDTAVLRDALLNGEGWLETTIDEGPSLR